jgi:hypothetical protein
MSGSAGLSPSRNRKPEDSTSSEYALNLRKECAALVAGQAALSDENKGDGLLFATILSPLLPALLPTEEPQESSLPPAADYSLRASRLCSYGRSSADQP